MSLSPFLSVVAPDAQPRRPTARPATVRRTLVFELLRLVVLNDRTLVAFSGDCKRRAECSRGREANRLTNLKWKNGKELSGPGPGGPLRRAAGAALPV